MTDLNHPSPYVVDGSELRRLCIQLISVNMPTMVGRMVLYIPGWLFLGFTEPSTAVGFGFHVRFEEISLKQKTGPLVLGQWTERW